MSSIILPRRFTSQPQYPALVAAGNPYDIAFCYNAAVGFVNLANGEPALSVNGSFPVGLDVSGQTIEPRSGSTYAIFNPNGMQNATEATLIAIWASAAPAGWSYNVTDYIYSTGGYSTGGGFAWGRTSESGGLTGQYVYSSSIGGYGELATEIPPAPSVVAFRQMGGVSSFFLNGSRSSADQTKANFPASPNNLYLGCFIQYSGPPQPYNNWVDNCSLLVAIPRGLSDKEIWALTNSLDAPWQIFQAPPRKLWVSGGGGGSVFYSLVGISFAAIEHSLSKSILSQITETSFTSSHSTLVANVHGLASHTTSTTAANNSSLSITKGMPANTTTVAGPRAKSTVSSEVTHLTGTGAVSPISLSLSKLLSSETVVTSTHSPLLSITLGITGIHATSALHQIGEVVSVTPTHLTQTTNFGALHYSLVKGVTGISSAASNHVITPTLLHSISGVYQTSGIANSKIAISPTLTGSLVTSTAHSPTHSVGSHVSGVYSTTVIHQVSESLIVNLTGDSITVGFHSVSTYTGSGLVVSIIGVSQLATQGLVKPSIIKSVSGMSVGSTTLDNVHPTIASKFYSLSQTSIAYVGKTTIDLNLSGVSSTSHITPTTSSHGIAIQSVTTTTNIRGVSLFTSSKLLSVDSNTGIGVLRQTHVMNLSSLASHTYINLLRTSIFKNITNTVITSTSGLLRVNIGPNVGPVVYIPNVLNRYTLPSIANARINRWQVVE